MNCLQFLVAQVAPEKKRSLAAVELNWLKSARSIAQQVTDL